MSGTPTTQIKLFTGSDRETTHSIVGNNFTNALPAPVQYAQGYFTGSSAVVIPAVLALNEGLYILDTMASEGALEGWWFQNNWSLINTTLSDAGPHAYFYRGLSEVPLVQMRAINGVGIRLVFAGDTGGAVILDVTNLTLPANTWLHWGVSWSTINQIIKLYLNGVLVGSQTGTWTLSGSSNALYSLGGRPFSSTNFEFDGNIDTFTLHSYEKSDYTNRNDKRSGLADTLILG